MDIGNTLDKLKPLVTLLDRQTFVAICVKIAETVAGAAWDRMNAEAKR